MSATMARSAGLVVRMRDAVANNPKVPAPLRRFAVHPAGPFTIHFWAPAWKWGLVVAGMVDLNRPVEQLSVPQNIALASTGIIWSRYATQIKPVNYSLLSVNVFVCLTGAYQLYRVYTHADSPSKPGAQPDPASSVGGPEPETQ